MTDPNVRPRYLHRDPLGYSHVVEVRGGRTLYIAGQIALDWPFRNAGWLFRRG